MNTIRMPKKLLAKWLKALRSGEYKQAKGAMYRPSTCGFCCLGVLEHAVSGGCVEADNETYFPLPSREWLVRNGIEFRDKGGLFDIEPYLPTLERPASEANDRGMKFKRIADAIEACAEGY